ncbi:kinase-like domain-containing protein [Gigaspora rosea]|uniref:Kinase-like domain-containing protein n=1 Tax=Gigaspora rosea TaxID=44941 RepID=A0A397UE61_9GLOM|nr:kinase-like domain-containing protein [Gigaspora rosea]
MDQVLTSKEGALITWLKNAISEGKINCFDCNEFTCFEIIGDGEFGNVHKAEWKSYGKKVALKSLKDIKCTKIIQELKILQKISFHPNIIEFFGVTIAKDKSYNIIMEFAEDGNLRQYLKVNFSSLECCDKIRMAREIVLGLAFLHKRDVVHGDLHTENILVHKKEMKIADFGFSNYLVDSEFFHGIYGKPAFVDPQLLHRNLNTPNKESDIYSFGVILWEIANCVEPFKNMSRNRIIFHKLEGKRETPIRNMPSSYNQLYELCCHNDPISRPKAKIVCKDLKKLLFDNEPQLP